MDDIARNVGVSVSTVSRALREDARVAEATRQRVKKEAAQLRYGGTSTGDNGEYDVITPRRPGRRIPGVARISVILRDESMRRFFADTVLELMRQASSRSIESDFYISNISEPLSDSLRQVKGDALILVTWEILSDDDWRQLHSYHVPVIMVNRHDGHTYAVTVDDFSAGLMAARHLYDLGHRRVAYIPGSLNSSSTSERAAGFRTGLERVACFDHQYFLAPVERNPVDTVRSHVRHLLSLPIPPTAIATYNDFTAGLVLMAVSEADLRVPEDLSILGFDYAPESRQLELTTFDCRCRDIGVEVMRLLEGIFTGETTAPIRICVVPALVKGKTTGLAPGVDTAAL